ncbi:hypothetical protein [Desulfurococcus mucosus]|uniref:Uncharacterized protein n=1 Tax=Desulfurococcus mucosus (strain ATCC 35584 / DSM 2162 / JCM 9187 / O7/1) TaxID=765177 RepID=E8R7M1_DESM0|nr:hypothetical protein [Desulfurococcus mucosus]ADV64516.1 hypothetical protein Desmu_0197 [Desulfurococcus mucosus DSM 2162]
MDIEDKIWLSRLVTGIVYGVVTYILVLLMGPVEASAITWGLSPMVYYATVMYVAVKYRPVKRMHLYLRGLLSFYTAWLSTVFILYDLTHPS